MAAGLLVLGLTAAACGASADSVVSERSDDVAEAPITTEAITTDADTTDADTTDAVDVVDEPITTDAPTTDDSEPTADDSEPTVVGLPPVDDDCNDLPDTDETTRSFDAAPPMCLEEGAAYTATVFTSAGTITIDLDQSAAPTTVNSFVFIARNNYFDDTVCHRIIQEFVVQCGDPTATGTGGPGYSFPDELPEAGQYEVGSIAMANSGPDTNGSQFFIITGGDGAALPPLYSLFGQVDAGDLGVVSEMNAQGSLDGSGVPSTELRIESVEITRS